MKNLLFFLLLIAGLRTYAQETAYDRKLADSLGADDYGMRKYYLVLLKTGSAPLEDKQQRAELFRGHMANIERLAAAGQLIVAGPFTGKQEPYRGLFIFKTATLQETEALLATDPAIKAQLLSPEILEWYGSAALPLYLPYHARMEKKQH